MNENNANFTPAAPNFKTLVKMSFQGLTNFPYIEEDFDALTNYGLLSKVVEHLNEVISNDNEQNTLMTNLYNAYVSLQDYVNNYFDNLDVQEEINNKLDEMAQDGTLTQLIKGYVDPYIEAQNDEITSFKNSVNSTIINQNNEIIGIQNEVRSLASGSPKGVYATTAALTSANPDTGVYIVSANGHIYSWTKDGTNAVDLGTYQSTGIGAGEVTRNNLSPALINELIIKNDYLSSGADLNTIIQNGMYFMLNGTYTNCYTSSTVPPSFLKVERAFTGSAYNSSLANIIIQTIIPQNDINVVHKRIIYGMADSLTFGNWYDEPNPSNMQLIKNDYLSSGTDLNTITDQGYYGLATGTYTNAPINQQLKGFLEVKKVLGNYGVIKQSIYISTLSYGVEDLICERVIQLNAGTPTYGNWKILKGEQFYQYIESGDLNNYIDKGQIYLLNGTYTNGPTATIKGAMLTIENVHTYNNGFNTNSHFVMQKLLLGDNTACYIRTIRWTGNGEKSYTNWTNIYSSGRGQSVNILTLGDSILGMPNQYITSTIGKLLNANVYNCNFGGTTACERQTGSFAPFGFTKLVDAIIGNDYTEQEAGLSGAGIPDYFATSLSLLKSLDLSNIDICLVMYGTNDFDSNLPIGNVSDNNKTSILGSLNYGIKKLGEQYPNMRFIILNPIFRVFNTSTGANSKTYQNTNNNVLNDVDVAEINLAKELFIPHIDMRDLGINEYNYTNWLSDGTHLLDAKKDEVGLFISNNITI